MNTEHLIQRPPNAQSPTPPSFDVTSEVDELAAICLQQTRLADYPAACDVESNVLV